MSSSSIIPSLIQLTAQSFIPSSEFSIFGMIIPGVSLTNVAGSDMILNPEMLLVTQGTPPVRAAALLFYPATSVSLFLKELIIVDLPTLGTPPIISQAPTVLNYGLAFCPMKVSNLLMFTFSLVEICMYGIFVS